MQWGYRPVPPQGLSPSHKVRNGALLREGHSPRACLICDLRACDSAAPQRRWRGASGGRSGLASTPRRSPGTRPSRAPLRSPPPPPPPSPHSLLPQPSPLCLLPSSRLSPDERCVRFSRLCPPSFLQAPCSIDCRALLQSRRTPSNICRMVEFFRCASLPSRAFARVLQGLCVHHAALVDNRLCS